jgi:hypothetical protein
MGAWDKLPWDNDGAADWFGDLFDKTDLAKHVEETLQLGVEDYHEDIRAAACVLLFLGRVYIWPIHDLDRHLKLAADRLEEVSRLDVISQSPELVQQINVEIEELRKRIKPSQPLPQPPEKWWQFGESK